MSEPILLAPGQPAPDFTLPASTGGTLHLQSLSGKTPVVLYFYPRADTPGCTTEACGFRDAIAQYTEIGVAVLGISPDPIEDVRQFSDKFKLNFPLLADSDHRVCERYGVWRKKQMAGREYMGVVRTTFIINKTGIICHVFEKVRPEGHDQEVLAWMQAHLPGC